jgi:GNAT superfamily N-acetyltransferase
MITFRQMKSADIPAGLSLCRAAGWNQLSRDWELFLQMSPEGCLVAIDPDGKVVGTVTTVQYQNHFSWIGMVLVDPSVRKQGIGMQLLKESLEILKGNETVKLDATPAGREIYLKLNFVDEYPLSRMLCEEVLVDRNLDSEARPAQDDDLSRILEFDRDAFGADRSAVLEWYMKESPQYTFVSEAGGEITGYCLGRAGHNFTHIGPIVALDIKQAIQVVTAALQHCLGDPVIIDSTHFTPAWRAWLTSRGFIEQRPFIRMFRGTNAWPGITARQFAVLGPEFG